MANRLTTPPALDKERRGIIEEVTTTNSSDVFSISPPIGLIMWLCW